MANFEGTITNFVAGDDLTVERTITLIPSGQILTTAWLTVKRKVSDTDIQAVLQKVITSSLVPNVGQIDDTGADGTGHLIFYIIAAETVLLTPYSEYRYDIQVKLNGGAISTPELGTIVAFPQATLATS